MGWHWVNTPGYSDYQVAGKPLHAVADDDPERTVCGIKRKLWSFDLFNEKRCKRCARILDQRNSK